MEISKGFRHARAFNLDEAKMRGEILDPWMHRRVILLGDRDWEPKDCRLIILEGPELADSDLSMGRGWSNAEKSSDNVTRRLVEESQPASAPVVVVLAEGSAAADVAEMLETIELETAPWSELRGRILGAPSAGGPGYAAVLVIEGAEPSASWLFDAGLARGALGPRAVFVQLGDAAIPAQLAGVEVLRLEVGDETSLSALRNRLSK